MKIKTNVKAGGKDCPDHNCGTNHNEKLMKSLPIKTGVKSGGLDSINHNEKLTVSDSTEQKGITKKLRLNKETIRDLKGGRVLKIFELRQAAGGAAFSRWPDCSCISLLTYL